MGESITVRDAVEATKNFARQVRGVLALAQLVEGNLTIEQAASNARAQAQAAGKELEDAAVLLKSRKEELVKANSDVQAAKGQVVEIVSAAKERASDILGKAEADASGIRAKADAALREALAKVDQANAQVHAMNGKVSEKERELAALQSKIDAAKKHIETMLKG